MRKDSKIGEGIEQSFLSYSWNHEASEKKEGVTERDDDAESKSWNT